MKRPELIDREQHVGRLGLRVGGHRVVRAPLEVDVVEVDRLPHVCPARELYVDWASAARGTVAGLHLYAGRHPHDRDLAELIGELSLRDQDFRRWWAEHDVLRRTHGSKRPHHPAVGDLTLDYAALTPTGDPDQILGVYTAEPGSPSEQALRLLASWTSEPADLPRSDPAAVDPATGAG